MRYILDPSSPYYETEIKIITIAEKAFKKFLKNCPKKYNRYLDKLKSFPISIYTSDKFINTYGEAEWDLKNKDVSMTFTHKIEKYSRKLVYEIVSHELAHCIDCLIRDDSFHDKEWRKIHRLMNGTGETYIEYRWLPARCFNP